MRVGLTKNLILILQTVKLLLFPTIFMYSQISSFFQKDESEELVT